MWQEGKDDMKKRILALLLAVLMCLFCFACERDNSKINSESGESTSSDISSESQAFSDSSFVSDESNDSSYDSSYESDISSDESDITDAPSEGSTPLLYKVTADNGNTLWLFGSIHVGRDDFYPLPDYVMEAYEGSDALAVEVDITNISFSDQVKALQKLIYRDGTTIKDHISSEVYEVAVEILKEHGLYNSALDHYYPVLWSTFIENCTYSASGADSENGVDMHLIQLAKDEGKKILEIESADLQYDMLAGFSMELQTYLLEGTIYAYYMGEEDNEDNDEATVLMDLWADGDEQALDEYLNPEYEFESQYEELLYEEYNDAMLTSRNKGMAKYAEGALLSGDEIFICVGAAHVVGEGAIADLLRQRGYTVEIVK